MTNIEVQQILLAIIQHVEEGKSITFNYIKTWQEFIYYFKLRKSTKAIIKILTFAADQIFKDYCKNVIAGISEVNQLIAYTELQEIRSFYEKDLQTITDMINEYDDYLGHGHFWYSFLGGERDLWN